MTSPRERWSTPWREPVIGGAILAGLMAVGTMWLPWFRSGAAERDSFELFRAAQLLGVDETTPLRVGWFLLPVLMLVSVALIGFGARRTGIGVLAVVGLVLAAAGGLSWQELGSSRSFGPAASVIAGLLTMVLSAISLRH